MMPPRLPDPKALFDRSDRDDDGKLDQEEFAAALRAFHRPPPMGAGIHGGMGGPPGGMMRRIMEKGREMFEKADANHDGKISADEVPSEHRERFEAMMKRADKDGDKALSKEEIRGAMPFSPHFKPPMGDKEKEKDKPERRDDRREKQDNRREKPAEKNTDPGAKADEEK
jgi:Ca2+-binding EF-hand superfamily protein